MYLDGTLVGTSPGVIQLYDANGSKNVYVGAGYIGGAWPDEPHQNPNDNTDYPSAILNIFHAVEVEIASRNGIIYQIQTSTNLQTWTNLDAPFTGDGQLFRKLYPARENPKLFYRVEVVAP